jgi:glycerate kinase
MGMRILIAPDKFKGTLTAAQVARAVARGWRTARPRDELRLLPVSDGGDGFGSVLAEILKAGTRSVQTVDAAVRDSRATWWCAPGQKLAVIESARVIGLAMLPPGQFHPFELDTTGLASVLRAASQAGVRRCVIGIGGSATNDGGFGFARALGWRFLNRDGGELTRWTDLHQLQRLEAPRRREFPRRIEVAVDVQNPLLGPRGCTRVYGPQKGLRPQEFAVAERNLRQLARVVRAQFGRDLAAEPGAGAAGGLGFGLAAFTGAKLVPGFELVARTIGLQRHLRWADVVVTGEGRLDGSSFMGKGVGELARACLAAKVPCLALAGDVADRSKLRRHFAWVGALTDLASVDEARANGAFWLRHLAKQAAEQLHTNHVT